MTFKTIKINPICAYTAPTYRVTNVGNVSRAYGINTIEFVWDDIQ